MAWRDLIHLGDLPLTLAGAAAIATWMVAARAWRLTLCWSMSFVFAMGLVAISKIAFIVGGTPSPALGFRALSGHATGATLVTVMVLYLGSGKQVGPARSAGIIIGLLLGALMALVLVMHDEHSIAEAAAGWTLGGLAALGAIYLAAEAPPSASPFAALSAAIVFVVAVVLLRPLPIAYLMWRVARIIARHMVVLTINGS
jgi:hypothetical protein